jgi:uncharacterized protein
MDWKTIHLIKGENITVAYHSQTYTLKVINDSAYEIISLLQKGLSTKEITNRYGRCAKEIEDFVRKIETELGCAKQSQVLCLKTTQIKRINRITLHVANDCNLRCKYCYAQGGNYGTSREMMTIQDAERFVDFCARQFEFVNKIVFFGGEPLLNIEAMRVVCDCFKRYKNECKIDYIPQFVIITNGTILSQPIIDFIRDNISFVTVSIDGPKEINDLNRVFKNGIGSYNRIIRFIEAIQTRTNCSIQYEATYTQSHIDLGYSRSDVQRFLNAKFHINGILADEETLDSYNVVDYWKSIKLDDLKQNGFWLSDDFWMILELLTNKHSNSFCPIVSKTFSVSHSGYIYGCHILNGVKENNLGTIFGDNIFNNPNGYNEFYNNSKFGDSKKCKQCWANLICGGCVVKKFYNRQTNSFNIEPNEDVCNVGKASAEMILLLIASIRKDKELWSKILNVQKENDNVQKESD